jgi:hypothetical protein
VHGALLDTGLVICHQVFEGSAQIYPYSTVDKRTACVALLVLPRTANSAI